MAGIRFGSIIGDAIELASSIGKRYELGQVEEINTIRITSLTQALR